MKESPPGVKRILLLEDDPQVFSVQDTLELRLALTIDIARAVDEAVKLLAQPRPYALAILDIMMTPGHFPDEAPVHPLEAGYRLAVKLREGTVDGCQTPRDVPILIHTAVASASLIQECDERFGKENVFCKPAKISLMVERIRRIIGKRALFLCKEEDAALVKRLRNSTPFEAWDVARTTAEAIRRITEVDYAVVFARGGLSASDRTGLEGICPPGRLLIDPPVDNSLPGKLAVYA